MSSNALNKEVVHNISTLNTLKGITNNQKGNNEIKVFTPRYDYKQWRKNFNKSMLKHILEGMVIGFLGKIKKMKNLVARIQIHVNAFNIKLFKFKRVKKYPGSFFPTMNQTEAKLILNLKGNQTAKQIRSAHIKLMLLNHPDSGINKKIKNIKF
jgi:hypothetical protein